MSFQGVIKLDSTKADGIDVRYSIDNGNTWTTIVGSPDSVNWYFSNDTVQQLAYQVNLGSSQYWDTLANAVGFFGYWVSPGAVWLPYSTALPSNVAGNVLLIRFQLSSDFSITNKGILIDDFNISTRNASKNQVFCMHFVS